MHAIKKYVAIIGQNHADDSVTSTIENGFVHLPDKAPWLGEYLHELVCFPNGKYDDQADSTSQALDWFKQSCNDSQYGLPDLFKDEIEKLRAEMSVPSYLRDSNRGPW